MAASSLSLEAPAVRRGISVWRRFFTRVLAGPTPTAEDEIAEYLERHQRDLPPALRIELERRSMSLGADKPDKASVCHWAMHDYLARGRRFAKMLDG